MVKQGERILQLLRDFPALAPERPQVSSGNRDLLRGNGCPLTRTGIGRSAGPRGHRWRPVASRHGGRAQSSSPRRRLTPHVIERERRATVEKVFFVSRRRKSGVLHIVDICLDGLAGKPCLGPAHLFRHGIQARGEFFVKSYGKHGSSPLSCYTSIARRPFQCRLSTDLPLFRDFHALAPERLQNAPKLSHPRGA